jgi:hypothetical protein
MSEKQKTSIDKLTEAGQNLGLILMTAAVTSGLIDMPHSPDKRVILTSRPVFAPEAASSGESPNQLRRERDEVGPHYISYNINQRTPGRSGKA